MHVRQVGPPKPPSPVPEGVEEEPSPMKQHFQDSSAVAVPAGDEDIISVTRERNALRDKLEKVRGGWSRKLSWTPSLSDTWYQLDNGHVT